ncbi:tyrosine-type recombinase/integrase [Rhodococcus jostii]|uniref:tyrosine-type recombinase/integrase n=1 Tax=Rhodococcus jostii TaxID=132919 RepID=UPI00362BB487
MIDTSITQHVAYLRLRNLQPNTAIHRRGQLERLLAYLGKPLLQAQPVDLEKWQRSLSVSASSVMTYTSHVRAFYAWALEVELISADPARGLVMPKIKKRMPRPIPEEDLRTALITAQHNHQLYCWMLLAAFCGLRASEIAKISRGDLRIEKSGGGYLTVNGKGGHQRVVRVPREVVVELRPVLHQSGPIFRRRNGDPYSPNYLSQQASEHLQSLGLSYTLHTLRHRFATVMCDMGADVRDVQQLLGHQDLATTTLYVAHNARRAGAAVDKLGEGLAAMSRRQIVARKKRPPSSPDTTDK